MSLDIQIIDWNRQSAADREALLQRPVARDTGLGEAVAAILTRIREGGDAALQALTAELDGVVPGSLEVSPDELQAAVGRTYGKLLAY